jgi:hypothetical protein
MVQSNGLCYWTGFQNLRSIVEYKKVSQPRWTSSGASGKQSAYTKMGRYQKNEARLKLRKPGHDMKSASRYARTVRQRVASAMKQAGVPANCCDCPMRSIPLRNHKVSHDDGSLTVKVIVCHFDWDECRQVALIQSKPNHKVGTRPLTFDLEQRDT